MNDFPIMDVFHAKTDLSEPVKYLGLRKWLSLLIFAFLLQIATVSKIHDDAQLALFCFVNFNEVDDVWMT